MSRVIFKFLYFLNYYNVIIIGVFLNVYFIVVKKNG